MAMFFVHVLAVLVVVLWFGASAGAAGAADDGEIVRNGDFRQAGKGEMPADWSTWQPPWEKARCAVRRADGGLRVEAPGRPHAVGGAVQDLKGVKPGQAYAVRAVCSTRKIADPYRSLLVRLTWMQKRKLLHPAGWLIRGPAAAGRTLVFEDVLVAPKGADAARLSLELKWPRGGSVLWRRVSVRPAAAPAPRKVRIGTIFLRPKSSTPARNMKLWCEKIDAAGKLKLDVVCLGEAILQVGTSKGGADVAQPIPGPDTKRLGAAARKNNIWVVAGLTERDGDALYNTAVLIDRKGRLAGTYRKVHLPREEWKKGVTPGREYPVFETELGKVAIQICYDWFFPEAAEIFALRGAEILFAPTWGNTLPDKGGRVDGENVFRVRARDNGLYMVPCVYDGSSMVIDPLGRILATSRGAHEGVYWAEVDLARREPLWWVGHWRSIGPRHRMTETYRQLAEPNQPPAP